MNIGIKICKGIKVGVVVALLAANSAAIATEWEAPKMSWGVPDLQGVWTSATITALERNPQFGDKLIVGEERAREIEKNFEFNKLIEEDAKPTDPSEGAPTDRDTQAGYNAFWLEPGRTLAEIDGKYRTSIITDPENGKIPYSEQARRAFMQFAARMGTDNPEQRPLGERCLVGFGSSGGPPMLPVLYNNNYRIVQSPGYVLILAEMNHDARIIRMNDEHRPEEMQPWLGDSIGRWEGDTLVVETVNFHPQQSFRFATKHRVYIPPSATVTERFTRVAEDKILYGFTVEDEEAYTQTWKGELPLRATEGPIFEYACHEGNYALPGILAGARREEKRYGQEREESVDKKNE